MVVHFFAQKETKDILRKLTVSGVNMKEPVITVSGSFSGKIFVFTGELVRRTRGEAAQRVKDLGAEVGSAVTKKTDFVVAGEGAGSKLDKARNLGIKVINEKQFEEMVYGE